ncbi:MAG: hypothetical protein JXA21_03810 [Anaerolineae bacterium]|nr:hypothetical protein [Anaerolineae bacterium]
MKPGELYIRPAQSDELTIVLQLLKESARRQQEEHADGLQEWLNPPVTSVDSIRQEIQHGEFYLVYHGCKLVGGFNLRQSDAILSDQPALSTFNFQLETQTFAFRISSIKKGGVEAWGRPMPAPKPPPPDF